MRLLRAVAVTLAASLLPVAAASAQGPPPPTATNGSTVQTVAQGIPTPTQFAFGGGNVFVAAFGAEDGSAAGGIFRLRNGTATKLPGSPKFAFGIVWHKGKLYISTGHRLLVWSDWTGTTFKKKRTVFRRGKNFGGFNGLAFGPDGRIYAGVSFGDDKYEFKRSRKRPYNQTWVSIKPNGKDLRIVARGLRQPWMTTFVKGRPFLTVLAADNVEPPPPDYIVSPRKGQDYGFPNCNRQKPKPCRGYAKPLVRLPNHASPTGIGAIGKTLYVALFGGIGAGPTVVTVPTSGGQPRPFLTGYVAPVVALGVHKGFVYTGDLTGAIYRVKA